MTERTGCCILVDKEEIGSVGATGMQSRFFENATAQLMELAGEYSELNLRKCLANSCMLSSDVSAGYDPSYASCFEKKNAAFLGEGHGIQQVLRAPEGKSGSMTRTRSMWPISVISATALISCSRPRSWARSMWAAREPSPISWLCTA